jgi:hypothetical protein
MRFFLAAALLLSAVGSASASPSTQQSTGCIWLTAQLHAIQADTANGRYAVAVEPTFGPHVITLQTAVGPNGPQLLVAYTTAQVSDIAETHAEQSCIK